MVLGLDVALQAISHRELQITDVADKVAVFAFTNSFHMDLSARNGECGLLLMNPHVSIHVSLEGFVADLTGELWFLQNEVKS